MIFGDGSHHIRGGLDEMAVHQDRRGVERTACMVVRPESFEIPHQSSFN